MPKSARPEAQDTESGSPYRSLVRELGKPLAKSVLAVTVATAMAALFHASIIDFVTHPALRSLSCEVEFTHLARATTGTNCANIVVMDRLGPVTLVWKVSLAVGVVLASPVWLYQLWACLAPGLHRKEKEYALTFASAGSVLLLIGGCVTYLLLPNVAPVLYESTPDGIHNLLPLESVLDLVGIMVAVLGLALELPLLLVMLNSGGVVTGRRMLGWWPGMVMGALVFSTVVSPGTDPVPIVAVAACLAALYYAAVGTALLRDRREARAMHAPGSGFGNSRPTPDW
ncbi:twin-arginine translocase subunit TatC [Streptomyces sp. NPDC047108]|uniref:twin-arginine translocase subunit TatC n=1 Tax=Streptomyces sp. NPDC047108 TaxID=3155025 RepID=UPI0033D612DD